MHACSAAVNVLAATAAKHCRTCLHRFGLVRVRENAESIAFYGGEASEANLLFQRLGNVIANYGNLLVTSRNLSFFTSFYRYGLLLWQWFIDACKVDQLCAYPSY